MRNCTLFAQSAPAVLSGRAKFYEDARASEEVRESRLNRTKKSCRTVAWETFAAPCVRVCVRRSRFPFSARAREIKGAENVV